MMHGFLLARRALRVPGSPPPEIPLVGLPHLAGSRDIFLFFPIKQGLLQSE